MDHFCFFMFYVCLYYTVMSVPCSPVITCCVKSDFVTLVCEVFLCFCHFPIWCLRPVVVHVLDCIDS